MAELRDVPLRKQESGEREKEYETLRNYRITAETRNIGVAVVAASIIANKSGASRRAAPVAICNVNVNVGRAPA